MRILVDFLSALLQHSDSGCYKDPKPDTTASGWRYGCQIIHLWMQPRIRINETQRNVFMDFIANIAGYAGKMKLEESERPSVEALLNKFEPLTNRSIAPPPLPLAARQQSLPVAALEPFQENRAPAAPLQAPPPLQELASSSSSAIPEIYKLASGTNL